MSQWGGEGWTPCGALKWRHWRRNGNLKPRPALTPRLSHRPVVRQPNLRRSSETSEDLKRWRLERFPRSNRPELPGGPGSSQDLDILRTHSDAISTENPTGPPSPLQLLTFCIAAYLPRARRCATSSIQKLPPTTSIKSVYLPCSSKRPWPKRCSSAADLGGGGCHAPTKEQAPGH